MPIPKTKIEFLRKVMRTFESQKQEKSFDLRGSSERDVSNVCVDYLDLSQFRDIAFDGYWRIGEGSCANAKVTGQLNDWFGGHSVYSSFQEMTQASSKDGENGQNFQSGLTEDDLRALFAGQGYDYDIEKSHMNGEQCEKDSRLPVQGPALYGDDMSVELPCDEQDVSAVKPLIQSSNESISSTQQKNAPQSMGVEYNLAQQLLGAVGGSHGKERQLAYDILTGSSPEGSARLSLTNIAAALLVQQGYKPTSRSVNTLKNKMRDISDLDGLAKDSRGKLSQMSEADIHAHKSALIQMAENYVENQASRLSQITQ